MAVINQPAAIQHTERNWQLLTRNGVAEIIPVGGNVTGPVKAVITQTGIRRSRHHKRTSAADTNQCSINNKINSCISRLNKCLNMSIILSIYQHHINYSTLQCLCTVAYAVYDAIKLSFF